MPRELRHPLALKGTYMGCDLVKMRDELLGELYSSGATPKAIEIAKLQIESEIYNIRMTAKKVKNTE